MLSACVAISARPLHKIDNFYIFSEQRRIVPQTSIMTERDGIVLCRLISFISDQNYFYNLLIFARTHINALRKSYILFISVYNILAFSNFSAPTIAFLAF